MIPEIFLKIAIEPALSLLPEKMRSDDAKRMLLAICLQESGLNYRRQIKGPARGFPMFEINGVRGVMRHPASKTYANNIVKSLGYETMPEDLASLHEAFEHNDVLAIVFARLLLYTLPSKMATNENEGYDQYISAWRPGRPRPESWSTHFSAADLIVKGNP